MTQPAPPAFFAREGGSFVPAPIARGPWSPDMLHGRVLSGLFAREFEEIYGDPEFLFSRLTVDLFRPAPMKPLEITTSVSREGNRIRTIDASMTCEGVEISRANVVALRKAEQPAGKVWAPPTWSVPAPEEIAPPQWPEGATSGPMRGMAMWETRNINGRMGPPQPGVPPEQKRAWIRESRALVEGESLSPFVRVALAADYTNPFANSGELGLEFINADITLYLHRLPVSEWIGFEVASHGSAEGVGVGECALYDLHGPIGRSLVCALANRRMSMGPPPEAARASQ